MQKLTVFVVAMLVLMSTRVIWSQSPAIAPPPSATFASTYQFSGTDGSSPYDSLVQGTDGYLYGTTWSEGSHGAGTIFKIWPGGKLTTLYNFCSLAKCADGGYPAAALVQATNGNFYGTTFGNGNSACGSFGCGTIFEFTLAGKLTTLYTFCVAAGCKDGANPTAALVQGRDGNLYGSTSAFGPHLAGTVFKITPAGVFTTLHSFNGTDGSSPAGALIQGTPPEGNFYGTTSGGGAKGDGTVFMITSTGTVTVLHSFDGKDGSDPLGGLVQAAANPLPGNFYGTTNGGGAHDSGTVFKITPAGVLTTLYSFCPAKGCVDGESPAGPLIIGTDGNLWSTTSYGGTDNYGTIFSITPAGVLTTQHSFNSTNGEFPVATLAQDTNGVFYGTTELGGNGFGTLFSLSIPALTSFVEAQTDTGKVGATIKILGSKLTGATAVDFGTKPASFTVTNPSQITATVPSGALTAAISVTVPSLPVQKTPLLFQITPQLISFTPPSGGVGSVVVINGNSLTQTRSVNIGGTVAGFTVDSDTQLTVTVPTGAATGKITITTNGGVAVSTTEFTVTK